MTTTLQGRVKNFWLPESAERFVAALTRAIEDMPPWADAVEVYPFIWISVSGKDMVASYLNYYWESEEDE